MNRLIVLFITFFYCLQLTAQVNWEASPELFIEPLSPFMGSTYLDEILHSDDHPEEIFYRIDSRKNVTKKILVNSIAFSDLVLSKINLYCNDENFVTKMSETTRKVHFAAIPVDQFTVEDHEYYNQVINDYTDSSIESLEKINYFKVEELKEKRKSCKRVQDRIERSTKIITNLCKNLGNKVKGFCSSYLEANLELFSVEASYPRTQFSINGFTRDFNEKLFKVRNLDLKLRIIYDSLIHYSKDLKDGVKDIRYWDYVEKYDVSKFDMIFLLSGLTRNLPNLQYFYALSPQSAFLTEIYFWKIRQVMTDLKSIDPLGMYPQGANYKNPDKVGWYHYYTAAYQTCSLLKKGFSSANSIAGSFIQKVAYKSDKLKGAKIKQSNLLKDIKEIRRLMKQQGSIGALSGALDAGFWAYKVCSSEFPVKKSSVLSPTLNSLKLLRKVF